MFFSTVRPPLPSDEMFVTNGPAVVHPDSAPITVAIIPNVAMCFSLFIFCCLLFSDYPSERRPTPALTRAGFMTPQMQTEGAPGVECSAIVGRFTWYHYGLAVSESVLWPWQECR